MNVFRSRSSDQSELVERQQRNQLHQTAQARAASEDANVDKDYLRELTRHQVDDRTIDLMANMFSQDFVLSNLNDAEVTEVKWLARVIARNIKRMHPPPSAAAQAEERKVIFDDPNDGLRALTPHQENLIDQAVLDFITRPPRSRDGWQQDEMSKQVSVSKVEDDDDDSRVGGLFG